MNYNINMPWLSLDDWQKEYINTEPNQDCFLLTGRQVGKTTAMSIKAVELCAKHLKAGENILIVSVTEKQAQLMLSKALAYAQAVYPKLIKKGKDKPSMHRLAFTTGSSIYCYAAGKSGEGLRGMTIKKLLIDEGSRMSENFYIAVSPMLSAIKGSMDIASTPCGKIGFFYERSKDEHFKKFYVSAEDCPRHSKEFLDREKKRLTRLAYAQEYLAVFLDEMKRLFSEELIEQSCILSQSSVNQGNYFLGVDVGGLGKDVSSFEIIERVSDTNLIHIDSQTSEKTLTTETSQHIIELDNKYHFRKIGIDDGGIGFGVWCDLIVNKQIQRRIKALNNAARETDYHGEKSKKIMKEEMYMNLKNLLERKVLKLLDDDELKDSLRSVQCEYVIKENRPSTFIIWGDNTHIVEGLMRAVWLASQEKHLKLWVHYN